MLKLQKIKHLDGLLTFPHIKFIESILEPKIDQSIEENSPIIVKTGTVNLPYISAKDWESGGYPISIYTGVVDHVKGEAYGKTVTVSAGSSRTLWTETGVPSSRAAREIYLTVKSTGVSIGMNGPMGYSIGPYTVNYSLTIYKFES